MKADKRYDIYLVNEDGKYVPWVGSMANFLWQRELFIYELHPR